MAKINPFAFARPVESRKTFTFKDDRFPDNPVTIELRSPDIIDYNMIQDKAREFANFYSDKPFPAVAGRIVTISDSLAESVASIFILQEGADADRYTMEELVALAVTMPIVFGDIGRAIAELSAGSELGKLAGGRMSVELSYDTNGDTPSSMSE